MSIIDFLPEVKNKLKIWKVEINGIVNTSRNEKLITEMEKLADIYRGQFPTFTDSKSVRQKARQLYKAVGMEPSRYRPASEALLKRVLTGKDLYYINALVDFGNYCSLKYLLPVGLYDNDKISYPVRVRLGGDNEVYEGLGKPIVYLHDKLLLADQEGAFGNPSSDSLRTSITLNTQNALFIYYFPISVADIEIARTGEETVELLYSFFNPSSVETEIIM